MVFKSLYMKKLVFLVLMGCAVLAAFISCSKDGYVSSRKEAVPAVAVALDKDGHAKGGGGYWLQTKAGHTKEECGGACYNGEHADCYGFGNLCDLVGAIELDPPVSKGPADYSAMARYPEDFSDEEMFLMPARSFAVEGEDEWLNVPRQVFERDPATRCFRIQGITFTKEPLYINE